MNDGNCEFRNPRTLPLDEMEQHHTSWKGVVALAQKIDYTALKKHANEVCQGAVCPIQQHKFNYITLAKDPHCHQEFMRKYRRLIR